MCHQGMRVTEQDIRHVIEGLLESRLPSATICPSEAARALAPQAWRPLMPEVRAVAGGDDHLAQGRKYAGPTLRCATTHVRYHDGIPACKRRRFGIEVECSRSMRGYATSSINFP